jgi:hypothetical protein
MQDSEFERVNENWGAFENVYKQLQALFCDTNNTTYITLFRNSGTLICSSLTQ